MSNAEESRALDLFEEWLDLPEAGQPAFVARVEAGEPVLHEILLRLIAAHAGSDQLSTIPPTPVLASDLAIPERIGAWRLVAPIGQGGMGVVYLAERADGLFAQRAAIKLTRPGLFSASASRQFARERAILAGLQHPNIARLYDGGTSEDGLAFFVMELIAGQPIDGHCAELALDTRARIALVLPLCDAVQHAHQQLVVHADIKPANVLVDPEHGPKLLDFGISRLSDDGETASGERSGMSPHYASPQQLAGARAVPGDDIHALGVLLADLVGDEADEELLAVIAKARAAEPEDRYGSASDLADDLQRWLGHFPVRARPASPARAAALFVSRNRTPVLLGSLAVLGLIGAATVSTVLYLRAEARFAETRALSQFLLNEVVTGIEPLPGSGEIRRTIAERARGSLQRLSEVPGASDELLVDLAAAYSRVGQILTASELRNAQGSGAAGAAALVRAEGLLEDRVAAQPGRSDLWLLLARTRMTRAWYLAEGAADRDQSRALSLSARTALQTAREGRIDQWMALMVELDIAIVLANLAYSDENYPEMERIARAAIPRAATRQPQTPAQEIEHALRLDRLWALVGDARWYGHDDKSGALAAYERSGNALEAVTDRGDIRVVKRQAHAAFNQASTMFELGRQDEAITMMRGAVEQAQRMRLFDNSIEARHMHSSVLGEYAAELAAVGRIREALVYGNESLALRRETALMEPDSYNELRDVPVAIPVIALFYEQAGEPETACRLLEEGDHLWGELSRRGMIDAFDRDHEWGPIKERLAVCQNGQSRD